MARRNRFAPPGLAYHIVNRGNDRQTIYQQQFDYVTFIELLEAASRRFAVRVYGYCLMPNHFHLLAEPLEEGALSAHMQWLTCRYACHFRVVTGTLGQGHVFQRRFWSAPASDEQAFLANLRYIEANPVRGGLVPDADLWPWSSFSDRRRSVRKVLSPLPLVLPRGWGELVNGPMPPTAICNIRATLVPQPGRPRGADDEPDGR